MPLSPLRFSLLAALSLSLAAGCVRDRVRGAPGDGAPGPAASDASELLRISAEPEQGFEFPYYLFVPASVPRDRPVRLLVEPNNSGCSDDDFALHDERARQLASRGLRSGFARRLQVPMLVPVFPRPRSQWRVYTHSLDRDTLLLDEGRLARIDLQLLAMIAHARERLEDRGVRTHPRVWMDGFSASGSFVNRFAALHPGSVRAVTAGGVNSIPILPTASHAGRSLPWPIGISDVEAITGTPFDREAYDRVTQYIYQGYLDRNDTVDYRDAFDEDEAALIHELFGEDMGARWEAVEALYDELEVRAQMVRYHGTTHEIRPEMADDVVAFLRANAGPEHAFIEPHTYPFVPYRTHDQVHVTAALWAGDPGLPPDLRGRFEGDPVFVLSVQEWFEEQDHHQLREFLERAPIELTLEAPGHPPVTLGPDCSRGTVSLGDGTFQGFVVELDEEARSHMARGVSYALQPADPDRWRIAEGVAIARP